MLVPGVFPQVLQERGAHRVLGGGLARPNKTHGVD